MAASQSPDPRRAELDEQIAERLADLLVAAWHRRQERKQPEVDAA